jgi:hypothetical protein
MKKIILFLLFAFAIATQGCKKDNPNLPGSVTFWNNTTSYGNITVYMDGTSDVIDQDIQPSECATEGCANIKDTPGTYSFTASATTGERWSGSCTIESGGCLLYHLH